MFKALHSNYLVGILTTILWNYVHISEEEAEVKKGLLA